MVIIYNIGIGKRGGKKASENIESERPRAQETKRPRDRETKRKDEQRGKRTK